jgi:hypothetical protein
MMYQEKISLKQKFFALSVTMSMLLALSLPAFALAQGQSGKPDNNPGHCPEGYTKIVDNYKGGKSWTADADYESVILVGGPPGDGRNHDVGAVKKGETVSRDKHDISHICAIPKIPEEPVKQYVTIKATKIVCDAESYLPNWGAGGADILGSTADDWLAKDENHKHCKKVDWDFQWAPSGTANPGDNTGAAGSPWKTFENSVMIPYSEVEELDLIWVREVWNSDYIPFTGVNTNQDVSAEFYCHTDVLHYDNYEWINNLEPDKTYYCVAWNVPVEEEPQACKVEVSSQPGDKGVGNGDAVAAWIHPVWTTGLNSVATWIWDTFQVVNPHLDENRTFKKKFFVDGPVNDAVLNLAADNRYWIEINGNPVISNTGEFNYGAVTGPTDVESYVNSGWNTITMKVENIGIPGFEERPEDNPAAGIYHLVVNSEEETLCVQPEEPKDPIEGCMDVSAKNYNPLATVDKPEMCQYDNGEPPYTYPTPSYTTPSYATPSGPTTSSRPPGGGGPTVLGVFTGEVLGESCGLYMDRFIRLGRNNDREQVIKLQTFLNKWMNANLPITGFYGPLTLRAVNAFQTQYADDILTPWGLTGPTGIVYQTTLRKINLIECPELSIEIPPLVQWSRNPNIL